MDPSLRRRRRGVRSKLLLLRCPPLHLLLPLFNTKVGLHSLLLLPYRSRLYLGCTPELSHVDRRITLALRQAPRRRQVPR